MAYLGCAEQEVRTARRGKRNNLLQRAVSSPKNRSRHRRSAAGFVGLPEMGATWSRHSEQDCPPRSCPDHPSFNAPIYANLFDDEGCERSSLARGVRKNWV
ncbi:DUF736 family protein [Bradyrhizobium japonicum]|nr:DUF736 family protein [Bradyrhizobium japonicum]MBR0735153.1 DUF736 family protein [Bradyrhizobium japonicum]